MVILIGGSSHTGKTLLAQQLLTKYKIPYTSIDHIKMGLIRGYNNCGFTAIDDDDIISEKMWGVIKGIIDTCIENNQNIILEGCYLSADKVKQIICNDIIILYIGFSEQYIQSNFDKIIQYENIIERRKYPSEILKNDFIFQNSELKQKCIKSNLPYFEINFDYDKEIQKVYDFVDNQLNIRKIICRCNQ